MAGSSQRVTALRALNSQPLSFEENGGQGDSDIKFTSRGKSYTLFLTRDGAVLSLQESALGSGERELGKKESRASNSLLRMKFDNANPHADITGQDPLPGKTYYADLKTLGPLKGNARFRRVMYSQIYPGIDAAYYGNGRQLEFDFVVAAGADANQIQLSFDGASQVSLDETGTFW